MATFAVLNGTSADLEAVSVACEALRFAESAAAFEARDQAFHRAIAVATQNTILVGLYDYVARTRRNPDWQKIKDNRFVDRPERRSEVLDEHRKIVDRLRARDAEGAREAMVAHLICVRANVLGY